MSKIFEEFVILQGQKLLEHRRGDLIANQSESSSSKSSSSSGDKKDKKKEKEKEPSIDGTKLIIDFIDLYHKLNEFVTKPFKDNILFQRSMTYGFQKVFNENASQTVTNVEHLSSYVDGLLRGKEGSDKLDESSIETKLNSSVKLFNFIIDKDIFKELYKNYLSKRLLNNKISSMDMERHMITMLKIAQGTPFTQLIESMITDFDLVKDGKEEFKAFLALNKLDNDNSLDTSSSSDAVAVVERPCEPNILLLTREFWPTHAGIDGIQLPQCLKKIVNAYEMFFNDKHGGKKKLHW
eukprot:CAMPEP_0114348398 /NCGR_PEP_ID=MMETSP0101-20121206/14664_1 /TAXON_ID=38822 ORGANISM="Pteridomonas danica, Strain PT" /NCGR_SAMPLE_ID=MMETSP0101 /ASSEMBLY_ACC=CAM_ASM_000211 /LENGTH=294 /DNA_ID=CAMNT_0001486275 /DNA_START=1112 /DNA_END=1993 /DNA_ORIENTATION=+